MKRIVLLILFLNIAYIATAQQRYEGQWIGKVAGGMDVTNKGGWGELGVEKIIGTSNSSTQFSLMYMYNTKSTKIDQNIDIQNIYGFAEYAYTFMSQSSIRFSLYGGAFLGNQKMDKLNIEGIVVTSKDGFAWGVSAGAQIDFVLGSKISLFAQPRMMYSIKSNLDDFSFLIGVGMKFYF